MCFVPLRSFQKFLQYVPPTLLLQIKLLIYDLWRNRSQSLIGNQARCAAATRGYCWLLKKIQFIISLQKIRASDIGKREFKVKQEIVGNNIFSQFTHISTELFYLFSLNLLLNVNTFEVSSGAVDATTHWSIMSVIVVLAARSGVRGRDKSRNNRLKITLPGELSDATLLNTHKHR